MNIYKPEVYQGSFRHNQYFEGWYFKHVSRNLQDVISVIPGVAYNKNDKHSFIQLIDGISGKSAYYRYGIEEFKASRKKLLIRVGNSHFSEKGIHLDINKEQRVTSAITYSGFTKYPKKIFSPGIMGWYSFVPFMECKHGIVSVQHGLTGSMKMDEREIDFTGGNGYSEKDWGTSFPESWIWIHCNNFSKSKASLTLSVAKIPWLGSFFVGLICFLYYNNRYYLFATYNHSKVSKLEYRNNFLFTEVLSRDYILRIHAKQNRSGSLKAPAMGEMSRVIKESIDSNVDIELLDRQERLIYKDHGKRAGLEVIESILAYF